MDARHLPDLMVFLEVVRAGSLTRAAQRLNMVQSNVTARIKKLEQAAAAPLLRRHARGVRPTPAGEVALAMAQRLEIVLGDLHFTFGKPAAKRTAQLRIGAIETVLASHLPTAVAAFLRRYPQVEVSVRTGSSAALLKQLKDGDADAVLVSRSSGLPGFRERLAHDDELVVVAPAAAASAPQPWRSAGPPLNILVQRLGCSYTERLLAFLAENSRRAYRMQELGTLEGVLGFVETGLGIAAMPRAFVRAAAAKRKLRLHELPKGVRQLKTYLVVPAKAEASFAAEAFFTGWNEFR